MGRGVGGMELRGKEEGGKEDEEGEAPRTGCVSLRKSSRLEPAV